MPFFSRKIGRKGVAPVHYFKGTVAEVKKLSSARIAGIFKRRGFELSAEQAAKLRKNVLSIARIAPEKSEHLLLAGYEPYYNNYSVPLRLVFEGGQLLIHPLPVVHGISGGLAESRDTFTDLKSILENGFKGRTSSGAGGNVFFEVPRTGVGSTYNSPWEKIVHKETLLDTYHLEMMAPVQEATIPFRDKKRGAGAVFDVSPKQFVRINIQIPGYIPEEEIRLKKEFYKRELGRYRVPLRFIIIPPI